MNLNLEEQREVIIEYLMNSLERRYIVVNLRLAESQLQTTSAKERLGGIVNSLMQEAAAHSHSVELYVNRSIDDKRIADAASDKLAELVDRCEVTGNSRSEANVIFDTVLQFIEDLSRGA